MYINLSNFCYLLISFPSLPQGPLYAIDFSFFFKVLLKISFEDHYSTQKTWEAQRLEEQCPCATNYMGTLHTHSGKPHCWSKTHQV